MKDHLSDSDGPLISIILPTRNETEDITETLEAVLAIAYEPKEIIVVDDSTDETPKLIARYAGRKVHLIHRKQNRNGCCGARNLGMQMARGEIVVILNADNRPQPDFLKRILTHYQAGADYVIVQSLVLNRHNRWGQYRHASAMANLKADADPLWCEGISCRRVVAEAVGYIPGDFPVPFCRDILLGRQLAEAGFKKHVDRTILMEHVTPGTLPDFWHNWMWRGSFSALHAYYLRGLSLSVVILREVVKAFGTIVLNLLLLPGLARALRYARCTPARWRSVPSLFMVGLVQDLALTAGNFKGLARLLKAVYKDPDF